MKHFALVAVILAVCHYVPTLEYSRNQALGVNGKVGDIFDFLLVKLNHMFQNSLEPLALPDHGNELNFKDTSGKTWNGRLFLRNVSIHGLSTLHRSGHTSPDIGQKSLDFRVEYGFDGCKVDGGIEAEIMTIRPKGEFIGDIKDLRMNLDLTLDMDKKQIFLQHMRFTDAGKIAVSIHSQDELPDLLVDAIAEAANTVFNAVLLFDISYGVSPVVQKFLAEIDIDCVITGGNNCVGGDY